VVARTLLVADQRDVDLAITFFTVLTVLTMAATIGIVALAALARFSATPAARRIWQPFRSQLSDGGLGLAWLVAAVSTGGSLYFSEVAGFTPCRLCWVQRACMYPLVVVLAVALVWRPARWISLVMACIGAVVASYHILIERYPSLESSTCDPKNPCSLKWFERLGFITLPVMALSAFLFIVTLLLVSHPPTSTAQERS
jgi:disulfide bond formation protein DsbB